MNELGLAIVLSLWIATLLVLAIWVAFWKTRKKKLASSESEEFLSDDFSQIDDEPALETKLSSVQPIYKPYPITFEVRKVLE
jgi:cbb3-type cytochrome oxidase subunit 3